MPAKKGGLGKGLDAIFGADINEVLEDIQHGNIEVGNGSKLEIDIRDIKPNPYQPRKKFDEDKLKELAESIKTHGVFTPILVKKSINGYELIAGERRFRACKLAKVKKIPAIIMDFDDKQMMEIALLENIQRENLNVIEEALGYAKIIENLGYTQEQLAQRIGKSREHVTNLLRLLKLPKKIQEYVMNKQLSMGHVRALLPIENKEDMELVAKKAIDEKLSVRAVEAIVKNMLHPKEVKVKNENPVYKPVMQRLQEKFQTQVKVDEKQIVIKYVDTDDLNRILEILDCLEEE